MMRRLTIDSRMLGAAVLAAVAAFVVLAVTRPPVTSDVLVVAAPAAAGTRLEEVSLATRAVADPTGLVPASDADDLARHVLLVPVSAGTPVVRAALDAPDAPAVDVIGVELESAAAVHGALAPGDTVDVYLSDAADEPVASAVPVIAVYVDTGALGIGDVGLLLAVDEGLAPTLVSAAASHAMHLVRRGG